MSTHTAPAPAPQTTGSTAPGPFVVGPLRTALGWHRPLMLLAAAMGALTVVGVLGMLLDHRVLTGLSIWDKPTKFAIAVLVYSVSWAWLIAQVRTRPRRAWWAGTVAAVFLGTEMVVIVGQVVRGTTSHFNMTTPFNAALWETMGVSIVLVWVATLYLCAQLFRMPAVDPARSLAIRTGAVLAVIGMALGFLMTIPSRAQIAAGGGISGMHTVGLPDGGQGLPLLGWSTVGGDLRIPHFVGMHALQAIPLLLISLELLAHRVPALRRAEVRTRLVAVATAGYAALLALLTWQALRGQSIVHPDRLTLLTLTAILVAAVVAAVASVRTHARAPSMA